MGYPGNLIESELQPTGAFTGAVNARNGLVEAADGGTLFLDEIGSCHWKREARLASRSARRRNPAGGLPNPSKWTPAGSHPSQPTLSKIGEFREDLYYRLNVMQVTSACFYASAAPTFPAPPNACASMSEKNGQAPGQAFSSAMLAIQQHNWPGNVRELENAIERAIILCENDIITEDELDIELDNEQETTTGLVSPQDSSAQIAKEGPLWRITSALCA